MNVRKEIQAAIQQAADLQARMERVLAGLPEETPAVRGIRMSPSINAAGEFVTEFGKLMPETVTLANQVKEWIDEGITSIELMQEVTGKYDGTCGTLSGCYGNKDDQAKARRMYLAGETIEAINDALYHYGIEGSENRKYRTIRVLYYAFTA